MTDERNRNFNQLPIIIAGATFASVVSLSTWAASPPPSPVDSLVARIKAHIVSCDQVISRQAAFVQKCADEKAKLVAEQKGLGVSDTTINEKLNSGPKTRGGWRWP